MPIFMSRGFQNEPLPPEYSRVTSSIWVALSDIKRGSEEVTLWPKRTDVNHVDSEKVFVMIRTVLDLLRLASREYGTHKTVTAVSQDRNPAVTVLFVQCFLKNDLPKCTVWSSS